MIIVSKLGEETFSHKNTGIMAGGLDYLTRSKKEEEVRQRYIKGLQVPPGPPTQHGIYATPEWTKQPYPSIDWESISQNQESPAGWPRYPKFNEPGDVPGPPVQFGPPVTNANARAGFNFIPNGVEEKNLYFYHPDHLGSSSYITDKNGEVIQHTEYIAFGEVFVDEHSTSNKMPYLFNGKELDYETGLYYYGARYYDPKISIFLNVDPLVEKTLSPYVYVNNNPINLIDPTGMEAESTQDPPTDKNIVKQILSVGGVWIDDKGAWKHDGERWQGINGTSYGVDMDGVRFFNKEIKEVELVGSKKNKTVENTIKTGLILLNMYNGYKEIKGGGALLIAPEPTLTKVAGGYLVIDGAVRIASGPFQIYGIWSGNEKMENIPSNFLGLMGNMIDNVTSNGSGYTTGGNGQLVGEMMGDIGMSKRRLYEAIMSPKGVSTLDEYKKWGKIINAVTSPARTGYNKGSKIEENKKK